MKLPDIESVDKKYEPMFVPGDLTKIVNSNPNIHGVVTELLDNNRVKITFFGHKTIYTVVGDINQIAPAVYVGRELHPRLISEGES